MPNPDEEISDGDLDDTQEDGADIDDGGGDDDQETADAYAGAGPQRWWKRGGGGGGSTAVRAPRPRRAKTNHHGFEAWFDEVWWTKCHKAFNQAVLGRAEPESLPFEVKVFACDTAPLRENAITLVTQCSVDRLPQLEAQARGWNGPMSVAIFVQTPATDLPAIAEMHQRLVGGAAGDPSASASGASSASTLSMEITLVYALPPAAPGGGGTTTTSDEKDAFSAYERLYPINTLRNIATDHAHTELLFLLDVDFVPCRRLRKLAATELWTSQVAERASKGELTVCPAFEVSPDVPMPTEQPQILAQLEAGTAEAFHVGHFPAGHGPTNFKRWATGSAGGGDRYEVEYQECYEPYVIGDRSLLPRYDERFRGYGAKSACFPAFLH
jgi:glycosyltransferase-like protein LARGE